MDIFNAIKISSSALAAQRTRLNTISSNLANIETTRTPEGGPYKRRQVVFKSEGKPFNEELNTRLKAAVQGVEVAEVRVGNEAPKRIYNPSHADADAEGYVSMPNINMLQEMADMTSAARAYEANVTAIKAARRMAMKALEIGR